MRSYSLDDFGEPPYQEGNGIDIDLIRSLHVAQDSHQSEGRFGLDCVWFIHIENEAAFDFFLYEVKLVTPDAGVHTVYPFVLIHGTLTDGVTACWFSDTEPHDLSRMANALLLAKDEIRRRGWGP